MKALTQFQNDDKDFQLLQTQWSAVLTPIIKNPIVNGVAVQNVALIVGDTVINHRLGRKPQGWFITDINAAATVFRSAPFNDKTLTLTSSAIATAQLYVF